MQPLSTGIPGLDDLIDQPRAGDNLVVLTRDGAAGGWVLDELIAATDPERLVVVDSNGRRKQPAGQVLDWTAAADGALTAEAARTQLAAADATVGPGALFAIDALSDVVASWGDRAALDLFLWAGPRLFRRGSVAVWLVHEERHDEGFLERLQEVTQVVVEVVALEDERVRVRVVKADGRAPQVRGRTMLCQLADGELVECGPAENDRRAFGDMLRELRQARGMGQAELARRIGISPSALSQAERGVRSVSADTLMRIYQVLGVPLAVEQHTRGYRVSRRGRRAPKALAGGVTGRRLSDGSAQVWLLEFEARSAGRQPLFPVKAAEIVTILGGVLELTVGGHRETLHAGDSLEAAQVAITAWRNPADTPAEALWVIAG